MTIMSENHNFIGAYVSKELQQAIQTRALREGKTLSDVMREILSRALIFPKITTRKDGWPICPRCHEDELYSVRMMAKPLSDTTVSLEDALPGDFGCYRCNWLGPIRKEDLE